MTESLTQDELLELIENVFRPRPEDRSLALMTDLPDEQLEDNDDWRRRRAMVSDWHRRLAEGAGRLGLERVELVFYRNVRSNNADLPSRVHVWSGGDLPEQAGAIGSGNHDLEEIFRGHSILVAATELSATAPLKLHSRQFGFRAATMPGFTEEMIPALRLDYDEIHRQCVALKARLDEANGAIVRFETGLGAARLELDLRHRKATASGGLVREPGTAGNLPSGETYIVPYEGEHAGDASRTRGAMPIELDGELMVYEVEANRVRAVLGDGPRAAAEREMIVAEPGYSNLAELGLGILAERGIRPVGKLLLDEKLGLHIALGRSDHFGGQVGAKDFSSPDKVVHIDRVYLPEVQPQVRVPSVDLLDESGEPVALMRDGRYV